MIRLVRIEGLDSRAWEGLNLPPPPDCPGRFYALEGVSLRREYLRTQDLPWGYREYDARLFPSHVWAREAYSTWDRGRRWISLTNLVREIWNRPELVPS